MGAAVADAVAGLDRAHERDSGPQRQRRLQAEAARRRAESVQPAADPHRVEPRVGDECRAQRVAGVDLGVEAVGAEVSQDLGEDLGLAAGEPLVFGGDRREVRVDARELEGGKAADPRDEVAGARGVDAVAPQPGVDLHLDLEPPVRPAPERSAARMPLRRAVQVHREALVGESRDETVLEDVGDLVGEARPDELDRATDPGGPQACALVDVGDGERVHAGIHDGPSDLDEPVAVGIALHDRDQPGTLGQARAELLDVRGQRLVVDVDPDAGLTTGRGRPVGTRGSGVDAAHHGAGRDGSSRFRPKLAPTSGECGVRARCGQESGSPPNRAPWVGVRSAAAAYRAR